MSKVNPKHVFGHFLNTRRLRVNPFQLSIAFHIETNHLFSRAKQITGFYMKSNAGLKWVKDVKIGYFSDYMRLPCYTSKLIRFCVLNLQEQEFEYFTMIKIIVLLNCYSSVFHFCETLPCFKFSFQKTSGTRAKM